jgi:hypothetical protein
MLGLMAALGEAGETHYFRTRDGYEVDLVFKLGSRLWAVEIKLSASPTPEDYSRFNLAADLIGADRRYLVAQVARSSLNKKGGVLSLPHLLDLLAKELR